jgi:NADH-quinone oxidoreductase subunit C
MYSRLSIYLQKILPGLKKIIILNNDFILVIDKAWLEIIIKILKTNLVLCMNALLDIWVIDYIDRLERFELNYLLVSYKYNIRIILKINLKDNCGINSLTHIYNSAGWLEREIWDMQGIFFYNNNDLRRILTDYGFEGFPLRKDFPMSGFVEIRYDDTEKRIVQELLEISQEYRNFTFKSPWEKL